MSIAHVPISTNLLHRAAELVESVEGVRFDRVAELVGPTTALAMIVAHHRQAWRTHHASTPKDAHLVREGVNELIKNYMPVELYSMDTGFFYTPHLHCLDNFSAFQIRRKGENWPTVEHAYQAEKFPKGSAPWRAILQATSPHQALRLAHAPEHADLVDPGWHFLKKLEVMRELLWCKVDQHEYVYHKLLKTGDIQLVEDSPTDDFWGRGVCWDGENMLGRLWMEIRKELRKN